MLTALLSALAAAASSAPDLGVLHQYASVTLSADGRHHRDKHFGPRTMSSKLIERDRFNFDSWQSLLEVFAHRRESKSREDYPRVLHLGNITSVVRVRSHWRPGCECSRTGKGFQVSGAQILAAVALPASVLHASSKAGIRRFYIP